MGTRRPQQNVVLNLFKKFKIWMITFITLVAFFEAFVSYINHTQQKNSWKGIATLLRNETNSANSYQMSRILSDLEKVGWIKCVKLIETTFDLTKQTQHDVASPAEIHRVATENPTTTPESAFTTQLRLYALLEAT